ncbi:MAG: DUF3667 domain-containing protein [Prevotella sp.]|nr:DUF3667 domain-containing protein [Prevotella sp.]
MSIKENSLVRRLQEALYRLNERQERLPDYAQARSTEENTCPYCGEVFEGRYCPQCGTNSERTEVTFRNALQNVLDVWGLGNRPMWRTIKELFWRPGYMMRDYLRGRQMAYFPPVKMLFLLAMFMIFEANLLGIKLTLRNPVVTMTEAPGEEELSEEMVKAGQTINNLANNAVDWILSHPAQMTILECMVIIFIIARVFRRSPGFGSITRTESFFVQIYAECQSFCVFIVSMPLYVLARWGQSITIADFTSFMAPFNVLLMFIDFRQLFRFSYRQTLWRIIKLYIILYAIIFGLVLVGGIAIGFFFMSKANG